MGRMLAKREAIDCDRTPEKRSERLNLDVNMSKGIWIRDIADGINDALEGRAVLGLLKGYCDGYRELRRCFVDRIECRQPRRRLF
jgi:tRNA U55 pseudouridine synthase TruB